MKRLSIVACVLALGSSFSVAQLRVEYDTSVAQVVNNEIVVTTDKQSSVLPGNDMHYGKAAQAGPAFMVNMAQMVAELQAQGAPFTATEALSGTRTYAGVSGCTGRKATNVPFILEGVTVDSMEVEIWTCTEPQSGKEFVGETLIRFPDLTTIRSVATEVKVLQPQ